MQSEEKARRVIQFIECLRHTKGEFHGQPFKLLPWQEQIIRDVFGTVRDEDPTIRQYTTAYIEIRSVMMMNGGRRFIPARQIVSRLLLFLMSLWIW